MAKKSSKTRLRYVGTNAGIRNHYRRLLTEMVRELSKRVSEAILAQYKQDEWLITGDDSPADRLAALMKAQKERFAKESAPKADRMAAWFVNNIRTSVNARQVEALKAAGLGDFAVRYDFGNLSQDVLDALVHENASLIKTIGSQYLDEVEGLVMRSVANGGDLGNLAKALKKRYDITARRAAMIARDQSNKATETISRENNLRAGITQGVWIHIPGRKSSRPEHEKFNGQTFDLTKGLWNPKTQTWDLPGHPINCFPAWSQLNDSPFPHKLFRHRFANKLTRIITNDGAVLDATPNHPVLTTEGWKAVRFINDGDYLIQKRGADWHIGFELDADNRVATIGDLFEAFNSAFGSCRIASGSASHFHGDMTDGEVDVIDVASLLTDELITSILERGKQFNLTESEVTEVVRALSGLRPSDEFVIRFRNAPDGIVSGFCKRLALFYRSLAHAQKCGFFAIANLHTCRQKPSADCVSGAVESVGNFHFGMSCLIHGDDFFVRNIEPITRAAVNGDFYSTLPKVDADVIGSHADDLGDLDKRFSTGYRLSRVVKVLVGEMVSHVYNLETEKGWYLVNNVIVHNCNCSYRPLFNRELWKETS